jgi:hypothetical protein
MGGPAMAALLSDGVTQGSAEAGSLSRMLTGCRGADERAARVLAILVEQTSAVYGYLYLVKESGLTLVAPAAGEEPPDAVTRELARRVSDVDHGSAEMVTHVDWHPGGDGAAVDWKAVLLCMPIGGKQLAIGIAAVVEGALPLRSPPRAMLVRLARELYEAGDVTAAGPDEPD